MSTAKLKFKLPAARRAGIKRVLERLLASTRGQIFLVNLADALPLLDTSGVGHALSTIKATDCRFQREQSFLGNLRDTLQLKRHGLLLSNSRKTFTEFAPDSWIVSVMSEVAYNVYYRDPLSAASGHPTTKWKPGDCTRAFAKGAKTKAGLWIAAVEAFSAVSIPKSEAEKVRNTLGLVHIREGLPLVAMHVKLNPVVEVYRPTVVEANPNARFRQTDPLNSAENRWGKTVDLSQLATTPMPIDVGGVNELVSEEIELNAVKEACFYFLGHTTTDQSTTTIDEIYLTHILRGRTIEHVHQTTSATLIV